MFVPDTAKTRLVAVAMAVATAIPLIPKAADASGDKPKATVTVDEAAKPAKKKQKRRSTSFHVPVRSAWGPEPIKHAVATKKAAAKRDPIAIVLAVARAQIGKPYHWGSNGPNSFDCSGFTQFVWKAAGVSLPHNSGAQYGATKHVSQKDAKPGDLVFSRGHVGLYIGGGQMIHAPHTGARVRIEAIHPRTYGFGRPLN